MTKMFKKMSFFRNLKNLGELSCLMAKQSHVSVSPAYKKCRLSVMGAQIGRHSNMDETRLAYALETRTE